MVVIIERILWFVNRGIEVVIVAVIALMIIRMITDAMDLNPFAWSSRTIRRLTDGLVMPVRGGLRQFGVDLKFAPERIAKIVGKQGADLKARGEMKRHLT